IPVEELEQQPVEDDLAAVVREIHDTRCERKNPVAIVYREAGQEFLLEILRKVILHCVGLDPVVEGVSNDACKDMVAETPNAWPDHPAHLEGLPGALFLESPERVVCPETGIDVPVHGTGDLGMREG